jgi:2,3-bisphosphoglycerate-independent phosphoglycerate mutase
VGERVAEGVALGWGVALGDGVPVGAGELVAVRTAGGSVGAAVDRSAGRVVQAARSRLTRKISHRGSRKEVRVMGISA